jgi:hypothetical protein
MRRVGRSHAVARPKAAMRAQALWQLAGGVERWCDGGGYPMLRHPGEQHPSRRQGNEQTGGLCVCCVRRTSYAVGIIEIDCSGDP